jgi:hypothetical protein
MADSKFQIRKGAGFTPYHHGGPPKRDTRKRDRPERRVDQDQKQIIAWDGEGINLRGEGKPQSYVLFGSSIGHIESVEGLSTFECLDYIIETGQRDPKALHVGFAFSYDANMIIQTLAPVTLQRLYQKGWVRLTRPSGEKFTLTFAKGKFFRVTKYRADYNATTNKRAKSTVCIYDIFSFFASSFIKAYEKMVGEIPDIIKSGKAGRGQFTVADFDEVRKYWSVEIQLLKVLAEELRERIYGAGLRITQWHGPGALATYAMRQHGIKNHMSETTPEIREAARYAYAGGRFELFRMGRVVGPIYGIDINSAYPEAIAQLPSLVEGGWRYVKAPTKIQKFGVYHLRMKLGKQYERRPGPLFHRDKDHRVSFPWFTDGWYWSPEVINVGGRFGVETIEGWEYVGWKTRPFEYVRAMYDQRLQWKDEGNFAQIALKLCLNSKYGKLAQRLGWDEVKRRIPPFHQLEWAGWVTSYTRAKLFKVMKQIPFDKLIAVETDGLYTTMDPAELGIENSVLLGGWEITTYSEILYVQSGLAWLCDEKGNWTDKRRGLDPCRNNHSPTECDCPGVFSLTACRDYLQSLHANPDSENPWAPYVGETTRFIGLGKALMSSAPTKMRHCLWETSEREISPPIGKGKRYHMPLACKACDLGLNAYDMAHDLVIGGRAFFDMHSYQHDIPWEESEGHAEWRDQEEDLEDEIMVT